MVALYFFICLLAISQAENPSDILICLLQKGMQMLELYTMVKILDWMNEFKYIANKKIGE